MRWQIQKLLVSEGMKQEVREHLQSEEAENKRHSLQHNSVYNLSHTFTSSVSCTNILNMRKVSRPATLKMPVGDASHPHPCPCICLWAITCSPVYRARSSMHHWTLHGWWMLNTTFGSVIRNTLVRRLHWAWPVLKPIVPLNVMWFIMLLVNSELNEWHLHCINWYFVTLCLNIGASIDLGLILASLWPWPWPQSSLALALTSTYVGLVFGNMKVKKYAEWVNINAMRSTGMLLSHRQWLTSHKLLAYPSARKCIWPHCDLDLWHLTLKTFTAVSIHTANICRKFDWNPSSKYGEITSCW